MSCKQIHCEMRWSCSHSPCSVCTLLLHAIYNWTFLHVCQTYSMCKHGFTENKQAAHFLLAHFLETDPTVIYSIWSDTISAICPELSSPLLLLLPHSKTLPQVAFKTHRSTNTLCHSALHGHFGCSTDLSMDLYQQEEPKRAHVQNYCCHFHLPTLWFTLAQWK